MQKSGFPKCAIMSGFGKSGHICPYKQTDDECFYLWDTIKLNFKELYEQ